MFFARLWISVSALVFLVLTAASSPADDSGPDQLPTGHVDRFGDPLPPGAVLRLGTVRLRHGGWGAALTFSRDGKTLLSRGEDNTIRFWDPATGRMLRNVKLDGVASTGPTMTLSPDGKLLATADSGGIRLVEVTTGQVLRTLRAGAVHSLTFSPDGQTLIAGGADHDSAIRVYDLATAKERLRLLWHQSQVGSLACTPDGRTLISVGDWERKIFVTDLATGQELRRMEFPDLDDAAISPDGKFVALSERGRRNAGRWEFPLRLIDLATGKELRRFEGHERGVGRLTFSPDGRQLALAGRNKTIIWDVASGKEHCRITRPIQHVGSIFAFSPDGKTLATMGGAIHLWNTDTCNELHATEGHGGSVISIAFAPNGKTLLTASMEDQTVHLWQAATGKPLHVLQHPQYVRTALFLPEGRALVTGGGDSFLRFWDVETGGELIRLRVSGRQQVLGLSLSSDGTRLLAFTLGFQGDIDETLRTTAWELPAGRQLFQRSEERSFSFESPGTSPDGKTLVNRGPAGVRLRDAVSGKELRTLTAPLTYYLRSPFVFSPDGKLLAAGSSRPRQEGPRHFHDNYGVRVYDVALGKELHHLPSKEWGSALAFSPDSKLLAAASEGGVQLMDVATGKERRNFAGLDARVQALAFAPDGRRLAVGLSNATALVFDVTDNGR